MQGQQQGGPQVGMAMIPETFMDFSNFEPRNNAWTGNMDLGFNDAQVFSVVDFPRGPAVDQIDTGMLSGKSSNSVGNYSSSDDIKDQVPVIERMPSVQDDKITVTSKDPAQPVNAVEYDESDPTFALFADSAIISKSTPSEPPEQLFGGIQAEKVFARLDLVIDEATDDGHVSAAAMGRFERICSSVEGVFERIGAVTSHL